MVCRKTSKGCLMELNVKDWMGKINGWKFVRHERYKIGNQFCPGAVIMSENEIDFILAAELPKYGIPYVKDRVYRPNPIRKIIFYGAWK